MTEDQSKATRDALETLQMLLVHMKSCRKNDCPPDNYALSAAETAIAKLKAIT